MGSVQNLSDTQTERVHFYFELSLHGIHLIINHCKTKLISCVYIFVIHNLFCFRIYNYVISIYAISLTGL